MKLCKDCRYHQPVEYGSGGEYDRCSHPKADTNGNLFVRGEAKAFCTHQRSWFMHCMKFGRWWKPKEVA